MLKNESTPKPQQKLDWEKWPNFEHRKKIFKGGKHPGIHLTIWICIKENQEDYFGSQKHNYNWLMSKTLNVIRMFELAGCHYN